MNKAKGSAGSGLKTLNLKMKFVCAQCWRDGATNEPDKALQYCSGKAKHAWVIYGGCTLASLLSCRSQLFLTRNLWSLILRLTLRWTRDRWLLLVRSSEKSRWVPVRPIPHSKNFPLNYDVGFASSPLLLWFIYFLTKWLQPASRP